MIKGILKYQLSILGLFLLSLGFFTLSGQDSNAESSSLEESVGEHLSIDINNSLFSVHNYNEKIVPTCKTTNEYDYFYEVTEEDDRVLNVRLSLGSSSSINDMPWFTQANNYFLPKEFQYGISSIRLYLKNQVFLI